MPLQVIVERAESSKSIPDIDKKKWVTWSRWHATESSQQPRAHQQRCMHACRRYLVPADLTVGQFVYVIRKRIKLSPEKAIFIFIDNKLPPSGACVASVAQGECMHACCGGACHSHMSPMRHGPLLVNCMRLRCLTIRCCCPILALHCSA